MHIDNNRVHIYNHINKLDTVTSIVCTGQDVHNKDNINNNYSTVNNSIYSGRGPVGRPL